MAERVQLRTSPVFDLAHQDACPVYLAELFLRPTHSRFPALPLGALAFRGQALFLGKSGAQLDFLEDLWKLVFQQA